MFSGVINDHEITSIVVKQKTIEKKAKIIDTNKGFRIWYLLFIKKYVS
jgi:hypothetical protein